MKMLKKSMMKQKMNIMKFIDNLFFKKLLCQNGEQKIYEEFLIRKHKEFINLNVASGKIQKKNVFYKMITDILV